MQTSSIELKVKCPSSSPHDYDHTDVIVQLSKESTLTELRSFLAGMKLIEQSDFMWFKQTGETARNFSDEDTLAELDMNHTELECYRDLAQHKNVKRIKVANPVPPATEAKQQSTEKEVSPIPGAHVVKHEEAQPEVTRVVSAQKIADVATERVPQNIQIEAQKENPAHSAESRSLIEQQNRRDPSVTNLAEEETQQNQHPPRTKEQRVSERKLQPLNASESQLEEAQRAPLHSIESNTQQAEPSTKNIPPTKEVAETHHEQENQMNTTRDNLAATPLPIAGTVQGTNGEACCCSTM